MQLERELGGDTCHNIDRMLRIPYTANLAPAFLGRLGVAGATPILAVFME
jgi:hypothetical protein